MKRTDLENLIYAGVGIAFLIAGIMNFEYRMIVLVGAGLVAIASYRKGKSDIHLKVKEKKDILKELEKTKDSDLRIN